MFAIRASLLATLSLSCFACGGPPPAAPASTAPPPASSPAPVAEAAPEKPAEAPREAPKDEPAKPAITKLSKPTSPLQIAGKSISSIPQDELREAFAKAGWKLVPASNSFLVEGQYEGHFFDVENGKRKGEVRLGRPTDKPEISKRSTITTAAVVNGEISADRGMAALDPKTLSTVVDVEADVTLLLAIKGGTSADAKKELAKIVKGPNAKK